MLTYLAIGGLFFAALPSTTNYELNSYGFGSGGTANSSTGNYSLEGITGEVSGQPTSTANFQTLPGYVQTQQANEPKVTLSNPSSYYDKLLFVLDTQNNPTDALYALQISTTSNFSSNINYVKSDHTIGATLTTADYQTYASWGSGSGTTIIGLTNNTTYFIRAKATQGKFTESAYGPSSSAATVGQQISFCVFTSSCGSANSLSMSGMVAGAVTTSANISITFSTNADSGGNVYVYDSNGGLKSPSASNYVIVSASANLAAVSEGYGAQVTAVSQTTGGPLSKVSPFNGVSNNVGALATSINTILSSSAPLTGGTSTIQLQARPAITTPEANDYADTITLIAAAVF